MITFPFPEETKTNVIITFDTESRSDDSFALAYALMSQRLVIKGIIPTNHAAEHAIEDAKKEIARIQGFLDTKHPVYDGSSEIYLPEELDQPLSPGASRIVELAKEGPLTILCMTALTDLALAIRSCPGIAKNLKIIWAGGGAYPKGAQYEPNIMNDRDGANYVLQAGCDFYQIPKNIYRKFNVSFSELYVRVRPYGKLGEYLYQLIMDRAFDPKRPLRNGCYWVLGNLAIVGAMMCDFSMWITTRTAPSFTRHCVYMDVGTTNTIKVFQDIDTRFIMEDFYAKLLLQNSVLPNIVLPGSGKDKG